MVKGLLGVLAVLGVSLIPGLELRAGIPLGIAMGLSATTATAVAVVGNLLQIPLAFWTVSLAYKRLGQVERVKRWLERTEQQTSRYGGWLKRWGWIGLALFVVAPLPATGVWGGVVLARLVGLPLGTLWVGISLGLTISGLLYGALSHGAFTVLGMFR